MAAKTVTAILTGYFNTGEGKRPANQWLTELKALTREEKVSLAEGICKLTGDHITEK